MRRLRDLNLNALTAVESVHRLGSFTRAAEEINITPSAISQRIANFERQLGFKIFDRSTNSIMPTAEGREFVAHCREALDTVVAAGMLNEGEKRDKVLKISVLPTYAVRWLVPRLRRFDQAIPGIRLHISQSYEPVKFGQVDIDVAVRYGDGHFPGLESTLLMCEDLVPALSPRLLEEVLPDRRIEDFWPADLRHFTLMHSATCHLHWRSWLLNVGEPEVLNLAKTMSFDSCILTLEAATMGVGAALANRAYIDNDVKAGALITPFQSLSSSRNGWYLVHPPGYGRLEKVQMFREWLLSEVQSLEQNLDRRT